MECFGSRRKSHVVWVLVELGLVEDAGLPGFGYLPLVCTEAPMPPEPLSLVEFLEVVAYPSFAQDVLWVFGVLFYLTAEVRDVQPQVTDKQS